MQFTMHAGKLPETRGGYLNTGVWSNKAMEAASFFGETYESPRVRPTVFRIFQKPIPLP